MPHENMSHRGAKLASELENCIAAITELHTAFALENKESLGRSFETLGEFLLHIMQVEQEEMKFFRAHQ